MTLRSPLYTNPSPTTWIPAIPVSAKPAMIPPPVKPFNQQHWPLPTQPARLDETYTETGNTLLPVIRSILRQQDWPNPTQPSRMQQGWVTTSTPSNIPPPLMGRNQYAWPLPISPNRLDEFWVNQIVRTPPPSRPFNQYDWPNSRDPREYRSHTFESFPGNIPPPVMGRNQYDWPLPRQYPRPDENWVWYFPDSETAIPFNQLSWPLPGQNPRLDESWIWVQQILPPALQPHNQYDWPNPRTPQPIDGFWFNPALKVAIVPLPPTNYDWPVPKTSQPIDATWVLQIPLLTPPVPVPTDAGIGGKTYQDQWSKAYEREQHKHRIDVQEAAAILSKAGGLARAKALSSKQRSAIASLAAKTRWK